MKNPMGRSLLTWAKLSPTTTSLTATNILITTPISLIGFLKTLKERSFDRSIDVRSFMSSVEYLIVEEVDLSLLGYETATLQILECFIKENQLREIINCQDILGIGEEEWQYIPKKYNEYPKKGISDFLSYLNSKIIKQTDKNIRLTCKYIFVGATMPDTGSKGFVARLLNKVPNLTFIRGLQLHSSKKNISYDFVEVNAFNKMLKLEKVIERDAQLNKEISYNTLVFCKNHIIAEQVERFVKTLDYKTFLYHGKLSSFKKHEAILKIRSIKPFTVIVSTDAVARGFDLSSISHIIMFDFPNTVADFIHRAGRTSRARNNGRVSVFIQSHLEDRMKIKSQQILANIIRNKIDKQEPLDKLFSRKRSLRTKIKRYGEKLEPPIKKKY
jgi:hypothetical protein